MADNSEPRMISSADDKGHSTPIPVRVPPDWTKQIDTAIKNQGIPYRNRGDFIRDAIARHFIFIDSYLGGTTLLGAIRAAIDILEDDRCTQGFELILNNLRERVTYYLNKQAKIEAIRMVLQVANHIKKMPEGYWRSQFEQAIHAEYGNLLDTATKVSINTRRMIDESNEQ